MRVLVCVTGQKTCERLIAEGAKIAKELECELSVLHVARQGIHFLGNPVESEAIECLYNISSEHGADMTVLRSEDVVETIVQYARKNEAVVVVLGKSGHSTGRNIAQELSMRMPEVEIHSVYAED